LFSQFQTKFSAASLFSRFLTKFATSFWARFSFLNPDIIPGANNICFPQF
jgi:hypothetical protein